MNKKIIEQKFINKINKVAIDAGAKIMAIYEKDFNIYEKRTILLSQKLI